MRFFSIYKSLKFHMILITPGGMRYATSRVDSEIKTVHSGGMFMPRKVKATPEEKPRITELYLAGKLGHVEVTLEY